METHPQPVVEALGGDGDAGDRTFVVDFGDRRVDLEDPILRELATALVRYSGAHGGLSGRPTRGLTARVRMVQTITSGPRVDGNGGLRVVRVAYRLKDTRVADHRRIGRHLKKMRVDHFLPFCSSALARSVPPRTARKMIRTHMPLGGDECDEFGPMLVCALHTSESLRHRMAIRGVACNATHTWDELFQQAQSCIDSQCSICMDEYAYNNRVLVLRCGHSFHEGCISKWMHRALDETQDWPTCPICRTALNSEVEVARDHLVTR